MLDKIINQHDRIMFIAPDDETFVIDQRDQFSKIKYSHGSLDQNFYEGNLFLTIHAVSIIPNFDFDIVFCREVWYTCCIKQSWAAFAQRKGIANEKL